MKLPVYKNCPTCRGEGYEEKLNGSLCHTCVELFVRETLDLLDLLDSFANSYESIEIDKVRSRIKEV
jgi:hypothetical protein